MVDVETLDELARAVGSNNLALIIDRLDRGDRRAGVVDYRICPGAQQKSVAGARAIVELADDIASIVDVLGQRKRRSRRQQRSKNAVRIEKQVQEVDIIPPITNILAAVIDAGWFGVCRSGIVEFSEGLCDQLISV